MDMLSTIVFDDLDILVVDDDATCCSVIEKILGKFGARIQTAHNGFDALELFNATRHPVVVTDICMPGMDGLQLVASLRQLDASVQVIAATAVHDTARLISAIKLGFNDYIIKPVELEKLVWAVKRCSETHAAQSALEEERSKFKSVVECLGDGLAIKDTGCTVLYQNRAMREMFGAVVGKPCYSIWNRRTPCVGCPTEQVMKDGVPHTFTRTYDKNGTTIVLETTVSQLRDSRGLPAGNIEIFRDVSERAKSEQIIREMAFNDHLTGLANRRLFADRLSQAIAKAHRQHIRFSLIYIDLDHFKVINDTLGHDTGDQVLVETAERIRTCCRRSLDTIGRYGGDEYCVIIDECGDRESLEIIARKMQAAIAAPLVIDGRNLAISASLGISIYPLDGTSARDLELAADQAMYVAKKNGRSTFRFAAAETFDQQLTLPERP